MYFALYLKIKNADFTGGLWWTVTYMVSDDIKTENRILDFDKFW